MTTIRNARIASTSLGVEPRHGILVAEVILDYGGVSQGFMRPIDKGNALEVILGIIGSVGVEEWEELKGRYCRVRIIEGIIVQLGHIVEEKWTLT